MLKRLIEIVCDGCGVSGGQVPSTVGNAATTYRYKLRLAGWRRPIEGRIRGKDLCPECVDRKKPPADACEGD